MSSNELSKAIALKIDKVEENKKLVAWGKFGVQLYHADIELQLRAQEIIKGLIEPDTAEKIKDAEASIAVAKKAKKQLQDDRIKITTARFDPVVTRLMVPEKDIDAAIINAEAAILKAKQKQRDDLKANENKEKEVKAIIEQIRIYIADMNSAFLNAQAKLLKDSYEYALKHEIQDGAQLDEYLLKVKGRVTIANHTMPKPVPVFKYNTQEKINEIVAEYFKPLSGQNYVDSFRLDLAVKFKDWDNALRNKDRASELNAEEFNQTVDALTDLKEKETISAKLETIAAPSVEQADTKPLKEVFKIDVDNFTINDSFFVMNAFLINRQITEPQLRKINPINLSVKQMISALEAIKNDDNNFECTGITFKKIDKL